MLTFDERKQLEAWIGANDARLSEQNVKTRDAAGQARHKLSLDFSDDVYGRTRRRLRKHGYRLRHWGCESRADPEGGLSALSVRERYRLVVEIWVNVPPGGIAIMDLRKRIQETWRRVALSAIMAQVKDARAQCCLYGADLDLAGDPPRVYRKSDRARPERKSDET